MHQQVRVPALTVLSSLILAACGGGGGGDTPPPTVSPDARVQAATSTANNNEMCVAIQPFYWEIGDKTGVPLASGSVGNNAPGRNDSMQIASASKWVYATYAVEKLGGMAKLDPNLDVPFLNFTSGYTWEGTGGPILDLDARCQPTDTVSSCVAGHSDQTLPVARNVGVFHYNGGHMEEHANSSRMGLGPDGIEALSNTVLAAVTGVGFKSDVNQYTQPLLAGGIGTSSATYATMLARILSGQLQGMHDVLVDDGKALGAAKFKVATTGGDTSSPMAGVPNAAGATEAWNYSIGHWVEDDPTYGDHALSSAGAFGFYPWIDKTLTYYGIVGRKEPPIKDPAQGFQSAQCGRLIRQAWVTGVAVTAKVPTPNAQ